MPAFLRFNAPVQHMNFIYFGGITRIRPPILTIVQTDGSFHLRTRSGKAGALLLRPDHTFSSHIEPLHGLASSMEAEWASIHLGLSVAAQMRQPAVGLENDCLSVISHIAFNSPPVRQEYARYYHHKIRELSRQFDWCGIRWIPREQNRADKLLR
jgi:ribonuclease HI